MWFWYYDFKEIRKEIIKRINKKYRINYININNLKIKSTKNIYFLINAELNGIEKLNKIINFLKNKSFVENKNIKIIFVYNKSQNLIDYFLLKIAFKNNNVLGKIKVNKNNNYFIDKKIIKNFIK